MIELRFSGIIKGGASFVCKIKGGHVLQSLETPGLGESILLINCPIQYTQYQALKLNQVYTTYKERN